MNRTKPFFGLFLAAIALISSDVNPLHAARGRVRVVQNGAWDYETNQYDPGAPGQTVVTDQGTLLRALTFHCRTFRSWGVEYANDFNNWKQIPENGFNCVRLNLHNWTPDELGDPIYYTDEEWLEQIDQWVDWGEEVGIYVILDYHEVGTYNRTWLRTFWQSVAPRYRHRTHVIYEVANEPVSWTPDDYTLTDILVQQQMYNLMRAYAPETHIVLLSFAVPDPRMDAVAGQLDVDWTNASVGFHGYWRTSALYIDFLKRRYPVFNTEFSSPLDDFPGSQEAYYLEGYDWQCELMEKWKISWCIWEAHNRAESTNTVLPALLEDARENGYDWEPDDFGLDGTIQTDMEEWTWMAKNGWAYSHDFGWIYRLSTDEGLWLYNASDDSWRLSPQVDG